MAEQIRKRNEIDAKYKWDLTHIYPTVEAWEEDFAALGGKIAEFAAYDGMPLNVSSSRKASTISRRSTLCSVR